MTNRWALDPDTGAPVGCKPDKGSSPRKCFSVKEVRETNRKWRPCGKLDPWALDAPLARKNLGSCQEGGNYNTHPNTEWSSSDENVAKVDDADGVVTAVGPGTATITAKIGDCGERRCEGTVDVTVVGGLTLLTWKVSGGGAAACTGFAEKFSRRYFSMSRSYDAAWSGCRVISSDGLNILDAKESGLRKLFIQENYDLLGPSGPTGQGKCFHPETITRTSTSTVHSPNPRDDFLPLGKQQENGNLVILDPFSGLTPFGLSESTSSRVQTGVDCFGVPYEFVLDQSDTSSSTSSWWLHGQSPEGTSDGRACCGIWGIFGLPGNIPADDEAGTTFSK